MKTLVRFVLLLAVLLLGVADQGISQAFTCTIQNQSVNAGVFSFDIYIVRTGTALYWGLQILCSRSTAPILIRLWRWSSN